MSHGDFLHPMPRAPQPRSRHDEADDETVERLMEEFESPDTIKTHLCGEIDLRAPWKLPT